MDKEPQFGGLLRALRTASGLTQQDVAARTGLSVRAIGDLERGLVRRPRRRTVDLLVAVLGLGAKDAGALTRLAGHQGAVVREARRHAALAWAEAVCGDPESALDHALDGLALSRVTGDPFGEGDVLDTLAFLNYCQGQWDSALEYYRRAEAAFTAAGARRERLRTLVRISTVHARRGDAEAAARLLREASDLAEESGLPWDVAVAEANAVLKRFGRSWPRGVRQIDKR